MTAVRAEQRQVARIWYPEPRGDLFQLPNGSNAHVVEGPAAYQCSCGTKIHL